MHSGADAERLGEGGGGAMVGGESVVASDDIATEVREVHGSERTRRRRRRRTATTLRPQLVGIHGFTFRSGADTI